MKNTVNTPAKCHTTPIFSITKTHWPHCLLAKSPAVFDVAKICFANWFLWKFYLMGKSLCYICTSWVCLSHLYSRKASLRPNKPALVVRFIHLVLESEVTGTRSLYKMKRKLDWFVKQGTASQLLVAYILEIKSTANWNKTLPLLQLYHRANKHLNRDEQISNEEAIFKARSQLSPHCGIITRKRFLCYWPFVRRIRQ